MSEPLPLHANLDDIPWESTPSEGRYGSDDKIVAEHVAQQRLDLAITRLAPGKSSCPYHYHHAGEELFFVLEGTGQVRLGGKTYPLRPHDVISCPPGPEGAHQIINTGDQPLVYMAISTNDDVEIAEYPDSGKVMSYVRRGGERMLGHVSRRADAVPYMDGEPV
ncbi:MAG: hypothetical protein JWM80_5839 [Cyanobacteria bacterium RYN_339]|nr:hypothetical protein [Cyanobacteria bacterium RYN_339]